MGKRRVECPYNIHCYMKSWLHNPLYFTSTNAPFIAFYQRLYRIFHPLDFLIFFVYSTLYSLIPPSLTSPYLFFSTPFPFLTSPFSYLIPFFCLILLLSFHLLYFSSFLFLSPPLLSFSFLSFQFLFLPLLSYTFPSSIHHFLLFLIFHFLYFP